MVWDDEEKKKARWYQITMGGINHGNKVKLLKKVFTSIHQSANKVPEKMQVT